MTPTLNATRIKTEITPGRLRLLWDKQKTASRWLMPVQIQAICTSSSATKDALRCIPGIGHHEAAALCMLGSLQAIAASSVQEILMATDLNESQ